MNLATFNAPEGVIRFFFRPKGTVVKKQASQFVPQRDQYIIQWEGSPEVDSGFHAWKFSTKREALKFWNSLYPEKTVKA